MGGNLINIIDLDGREQKFHSYWDNLFFHYKYIYRPITEWAQNYIDNITKTILEKYPYNHFDSDFIEVFYINFRI